METEFDRQFLQGHPETQVSPSYDQNLAYRQSLFTQAPVRGKAPVFTNRPIVRSALYGAGLGARRRPLISSSPPINDDEPNEYVMGSFVVDDDAEITYASSEL
jgi:ATP-dependent DNA helicase MPH1